MHWKLVITLTFAWIRNAFSLGRSACISFEEKNSLLFVSFAKFELIIFLEIESIPIYCGMSAMSPKCSTVLSLRIWKHFFINCIGFLCRAFVCRHCFSSVNIPLFWDDIFPLGFRGTKVFQAGLSRPTWWFPSEQTNKRTVTVKLSLCRLGGRSWGHICAESKNVI